MTIQQDNSDINIHPITMNSLLRAFKYYMNTFVKNNIEKDILIYPNNGYDNIYTFTTDKLKNYIHYIAFKYYGFTYKYDEKYNLLSEIEGSENIDIFKIGILTSSNIEGNCIIKFKLVEPIRNEINPKLKELSNYNILLSNRTYTFTFNLDEN